MSISRRNFKNHKKGFTLVELLVTITIFVMLTAVVLWNQEKFNSTILLTNLAYDTALTIRQAQTYGINIKKFNTGTEKEFVPYGVHFDMEDTKSFILFADEDWDGEDSDGLFWIDSLTPLPTSCNESDGCVSRYTIKRGNRISALCAEDVLEERDVCGQDKDLQELDIVFTRPNPDAMIKGIKINSTTVTVIDSTVTIILAGVDGGSFRKIKVGQNGLISIAK
ncbi:MAG: prepilin-type N-terminal cleavage/methylation domain-containing protein [Candidatus Paceibacterota bacterium]